LRVARQDHGPGHRIAELALNPGIVAQDGFLTTHLIESLRLPERELISAYLGRPEDVIPSATPAQQILYGEKRRRIPELWDVDNPVMAGIVQTLGASEADPSRGAAYQRDETIRHGVYLRSRWIAPAVVASPTGSGKSCSGRAANFS